MPPFRIREDARRWFKDLRDNGFSADFDSFYFCFMAGITANRKLDAATATTAELVDYFPDRYKTRGKLLVAIFLSQELKELGVDMSEKKVVHAEIARLVMPESPNFLSDV